MIVIGSDNGYLYAFGSAKKAPARPATIELRPKPTTAPGNGGEK